LLKEIVLGEKKGGRIFGGVEIFFLLVFFFFVFEAKNLAAALVL